MKMVTNFICGELLEEILACLPMKSLVRFSCVSKTWLDIITDLSFLNHDKNLLLLWYTNSQVPEQQFLLYPEEQFPENYTEKLVSPFRTSTDYIRFIGSCNGLIICSAYSFLNEIDCCILWNPSIRKTTIVPAPVIVPEPNPDISRFCWESRGFGFDSLSNEYKLVNITSFSGTETFVHVYSITNRSWRKVDNHPKSNILTKFQSAFINGSCHWLAYSSERKMKFVLCFNLGDEIFRTMEIPDCLVVPDYLGGMVSSDITIDELDGTLMLLQCCRCYIGGGLLCSVWAMKEYGVVESWSMLYSINNKSVEGVENIVKFTRNGDFVLERIGGELVCYDGKTNEIRNCMMNGDKYSFRLNNYMESLVLLGEEIGCECNETVDKLKKRIFSSQNEKNGSY